MPQVIKPLRQIQDVSKLRVNAGVQLDQLGAKVERGLSRQQKIVGIWNKLRDWHGRWSEQRLLAKLARVALEVRSQYFAAIVDVDVMFNSVSVDIWIRPDIKPDLTFNILFATTFENTFKDADHDIKPRIRQAIRDIRSIAKAAPTMIFDQERCIRTLSKSTAAQS